MSGQITWRFVNGWLFQKFLDLPNVFFDIGCLDNSVSRNIFFGHTNGRNHGVTIFFKHLYTLTRSRWVGIHELIAPNGYKWLIANNRLRTQHRSSVAIWTFLPHVDEISKFCSFL